MSIHQHLEQLSSLCQSLQIWGKRFDNNEISNIFRLKETLQQDIQRFEQEQQTLNIAIMGQVKAGKSSFLNALLFDGKPVLPTAATPKTANLTRISYGATPSLEIEYYSKEEWADLEQLAQENYESESVKVAKELVEMVEKAGLDVSVALEQQHQRIETTSLDELMHILNKYAGNDGQYTALVKMTRLYLPNEELKGFDVIDTPGMNDPVISRTQKTKEEMARCDVVFFLSRASQFLDQSDIDLLTEQLPQGGVERLYLIAGQYDSAILDDGFNQDSLLDCENNLQRRLNKRAVKELGELAEKKRKAGHEHLANLLENLVNPIVSSTFAHGFATWDPSTWDASMKHVYQELKETADNDWDGYQLTQQDWQRIANFDALKEKYQIARIEKNQILESKKQSLLPKAQEKLDETLTDLRETVEGRIIRLNTQDISQLTESEKQLEQRIRVISAKLEQHISTELTSIQKASNSISQELQKSIQQYTQLTTRTGSETHEEAYEVSTSKWYNPFSWGSSETRYRTYTTNYEYLSASDAVEQIAQYARNCKVDIQYHFNDLIRPSQLKLNLRRALVNELNTAQADFDANQFKNVLDAVIRQLDLPELKLEIGDPTRKISQNFSGQIRSSNDMQKLKQALHQSLQEVFKLLNEQFKASTKQIELNLIDTQNQLAHKMTQGLEKELEQIKQDFAEKQKAVQEYEALKALITDEALTKKIA
ncbi:dynamin family protein [Acinetobacter lwoffii]|jgi:predicted GTPase|uniref:dynamin family protein n=1 Tax=Acinetobacter lwoffii TaxID=28090 RepID=UPI002096C26E|nr:dynamin family protein [Acinetobacter lwoffii]MCO8069822.1 dynamin family protein [Acinetobacter lwoffii]